MDHIIEAVYPEQMCLANSLSLSVCICMYSCNDIQCMEKPHRNLPTTATLYLVESEINAKMSIHWLSIFPTYSEKAYKIISHRYTHIIRTRTTSNLSMLLLRQHSNQCWCDLHTKIVSMCLCLCVCWLVWNLFIGQKFCAEPLQVSKFVNTLGSYLRSNIKPYNIYIIRLSNWLMVGKTIAIELDCSVHVL